MAGSLLRGRSGGARTQRAFVLCREMLWVLSTTPGTIISDYPDDSQLLAYAPPFQGGFSETADALLPQPGTGWKN